MDGHLDATNASMALLQSGSAPVDAKFCKSNADIGSCMDRPSANSTAELVKSRRRLSFVNAASFSSSEACRKMRNHGALLAMVFKMSLGDGPPTTASSCSSARLFSNTTQGEHKKEPVVDESEGCNRPTLSITVESPMQVEQIAAETPFAWRRIAQIEHWLRFASLPQAMHEVDGAVGILETSGG